MPRVPFFRRTGVKSFSPLRKWHMSTTLEAGLNWGGLVARRSIPTPGAAHLSSTLAASPRSGNGGQRTIVLQKREKCSSFLRRVRLSGSPRLRISYVPRAQSIRRLSTIMITSKMSGRPAQTTQGLPLNS